MAAIAVFLWVEKQIMTDVLQKAPALDTAQAAAFLGLSKSCLDHWRFRNVGPIFISDILAVVIVTTVIGCENNWTVKH